MDKVKAVINKALILVIRFYKLFISPVLGPHCKYYPSCSDYAVEALRQHGLLTGARLAAWRILRCNPFSYGGHDPVPSPHTDCSCSDTQLAELTYTKRP